jgi:hypothetical protein
MKRLDVSPYVSWKQMDQDVHVFSPGIEVKYSRQVAYISAITFGFEYLYDNFQKFRDERNGLENDWNTVSTAIGHEFLLGKLIFSQQLGFYLHNPEWEGDIFYQRYGLMYGFSNSVAAGINLKSHRQVAELIDFRMAISF